MWWMGVALAGTVDTLEHVQDLRAYRLDKSAVTPPRKHWSAPVGQPRAGIQRVEGVAAAKAWGAMWVDAPIEAVWMVLNDEARMLEELPLSASGVIGGDLHGERRVFEYMPLPLVSDRWWVVDIEHNERLYAESDATVWEMAWKNADPHVVETTHFAPVAAGGIPAAWTTGSWLLVDLGDDGTWMEYTTWSDPGGSLPVGPATSFAAGAVKDTLEAVAKLSRLAAREDRDGYQRPDGSPL